MKRGLGIIVQKSVKSRNLLLEVHGKVDVEMEEMA
jgi:hypothetical protein